jgi:hypothetical protein
LLLVVFTGFSWNTSAAISELYSYNGSGSLFSHKDTSSNHQVNVYDDLENSHRSIDHLRVGTCQTISRFGPFFAFVGDFIVAKRVDKSLGNNPFKGKTSKQISDMFKKKGFEPKGPDPVSGKGTFVNPKTGRPFHIDANHPSPKPPHVGVGRPRGARDSDLPKSRDFDL